ncbi:hypothetical protein OV079_21355 [Nannocystis pusilla]|uniref:Sodium:solute symporter family protein n=1 Tax=Nannocystis pusilla TaxID=889268 RepID=A0A9X3EQL7_9BACT|nr:hypothetical protein [Nannocystis pusilla]MCY1008056.1 hypothetical protein [Nannocystis pusilla]
MSSLAAIGLVVAAYLAVTLVIGAVAYRRTSGTPEDYFLGGRAARTFVLFMALFGTNVTPFVLLGIPGLAYHQGVAVFGLNAAIVGLGIPLTFFLIGEPARALPVASAPSPRPSSTPSGSARPPSAWPCSPPSSSTPSRTWSPR